MKKQNKISLKQVKHIAKLANLTLTPAEAKKLQYQLGSILEYVGQLQELNTKKVKPANQVTGITNNTRSDQSEACLSQSQALANAPKKQKNYFVIPPIKQKWH